LNENDKAAKSGNVRQVTDSETSRTSNAIALDALPVRDTCVNNNMAVDLNACAQGVKQVTESALNANSEPFYPAHVMQPTDTRANFGISFIDDEL
jgi:hypothetical protein